MINQSALTTAQEGPLCICSVNSISEMKCNVSVREHLRFESVQWFFPGDDSSLRVNRGKKASEY